MRCKLLSIQEGFRDDGMPGMAEAGRIPRVRSFGMPRNSRKLGRRARPRKPSKGPAPISAGLGARPRIEINHSIDRLPTNGAEGHLVARKHDAVQLGAKIALGLVIRALESAHLTGAFFGREDPRFL